MTKEIISSMLYEESIELFSFLPLDRCKITKKYLLDRAGITDGTVIIMAVPYASNGLGLGNISEYAKSRDYHLFFSELFSRINSDLRKRFPSNKFFGFSDHSPIDERHAAALGGLGVIGRNGLLLTEPYSSFVFLGEIITDMQIECAPGEIKYCIDCGKCKAVCPVLADGSVDCLSSVTQKKGTLNDAEVSYIASNRSAWGCDLCQLVCPYTERAIKRGTVYTNIPFFLEKRTQSLTYRFVSEMSDADFSERAYSWRGRQTVLRNLAILENTEVEEVT